MGLHQAAPRRWKLPFFVVWLGEAISLIGSSLAQFALIWWLTDTTGSATMLATATLVGILPGIFLGPLAGALIDRWDRRLVMIGADAVSAIAAGVLACLFWLAVIEPWHTFVVMFVRSVAGTFQWPAMQASTALMVPAQHLSRVAGLNQTMQGALNIVSPPLGAFLLAVLPFPAIMGVDVVTAALAIVPLLYVAIPRPPRLAPDAQPAQPSIWRDMREGLRYVRGWPGLMAILCMSTLLNLVLNPAFALVPILVTRHYGGEVWQLGWMNSTFGIGLLLGGITLGAWGGFKRRIVTSLCGLLGIGLGTLLIGLTPANGFWFGLAGMALTGFMLPIANGPIHALLQVIVAPEMHGRVFTLMGSFSSAMSPLGLLIAGPVADRLGVTTWFLIGGANCLIMTAIGFAVPAILHLDDRERDRTMVHRSESTAVVAAGEAVAD